MSSLIILMTILISFFLGIFVWFQLGMYPHIGVLIIYLYTWTLWWTVCSTCSQTKINMFSDFKIFALKYIKITGSDLLHHDILMIWRKKTFHKLNSWYSYFLYGIYRIFSDKISKENGWSTKPQQFLSSFEDPKIRLHDLCMKNSLIFNWLTFKTLFKHVVLLWVYEETRGLSVCRVMR